MKRKEWNQRTKINRKRFKKRMRRRTKKLLRKSGWFRYYFSVVHALKVKGRQATKGELPVFQVYTYKKHHLPPKPALSRTILFLAENTDALSKEPVSFPPDGIFQIPNPFSLTDNHAKSFSFLKNLFHALYQDKFESITLDYSACERIDVDASVCMDVMLRDFIKHYRSCWRRRYPCHIQKIKPVNYGHKDVLKLLFSIGAFKNLADFEIKFGDIMPFPLIEGDNFSTDSAAQKEIETTKMVDYIVACMKRLNRTLTWEAEDNLSKVIGEILINAAEHSASPFRYAIGYFQETKDDDKHLGVFNLTIFAFGNTIYQNFKKPASKNLDVVKRMGELSQKYTSKKWFKEREFEEETLWTLYALQEGVTSVLAKKRGNGSIRFIESFFRLKGDMERDALSSLTLLSGNTRIMFDGKYGIQEQVRGKGKENYKMMTFNELGDIEEKPDPNYVTFAENFFPGTMIAAKIYINFNNVERGADI